MSKRALLARVCIAVGIAVPAMGAPRNTALSLGLAPALQIPIVELHQADYTLGGSLGIRAQYDLAQPSGILLRATLDYYYSPLAMDLYEGVDSLSLFALSASLGYQFGFTPRLRIGAFGGAGLNYAVSNGSGDTGVSLFAEGGLGVDLVLAPSLGLYVGASYRLYADLLSTMSAYIGASYYLTGKDARSDQIRSSQPVDIELLRGFRTAPRGKGLSIEAIRFDSVFPVFRKYYDDHPVGAIVIRNNESAAMTGVSIGVNIKEYMNDPKVTTVERIEAGQTAEFPVFALFNERVLDVTEATKTSAEITVDYLMQDATYRAVLVDTVRFLDRNAMTWEDDRRAAAFVTAKDPAVLSFSKNVSGMVRDAGIQGVSDRLLAAAALHHALDQYGMTYVVDPESSYVEQTKQKTQPDFLQFPRQTLEYKAGDCDDLSILYAALLEAVGIESAFVTVPGHIFIAFSLASAPAEARRTLTATDDLIFRGEGTWVPVEVTELRNGFLAAWKLGARQWREALARGESGFLPVHEAWTVYEAVGLPGSGPAVVLPPNDSVRASFQGEMEGFVEAELQLQIQRLKTAAVGARDARAGSNRLGVLYARYGRFDRAMEEFDRALVQGEYLPALVNLGNVYFLTRDWMRARDYYERAAALEPTSATVHLGIARAAYEMEDRDAVMREYEILTGLDPDLAAKHRYLQGGDTTAARSAAVTQMKENVPWEDAE